MTFYCTYSFFLLTSVTVSCNQWPSQIRVANIGNRLRNVVVEGVIEDAVQSLKAKSIIPENIIFSVHIGFGCDDQSSFFAAEQLIEKYNPDVFLGPECSTGMPSVAMLTSYQNIPTVGYLSSSDDLSNKTKYTTLTRVTFGYGPIGEAIRVLLQQYNWTKVAIVRSARVECNTALSGFYKVIDHGFLELVGEYFVDSSLEMQKALDEVKKSARIVVLCFDYTVESSVTFLMEAYKQQMVNEDYVYIVPMFGLKNMVSWKPWDTMSGSDTKMISLIKTIFQYVLVILSQSDDLSILEAYKVHMDNKFAQEGRNVTVNLQEGNFLPRLHDGVFLYGLALNSSIQSNTDYRNGTNMFNIMKSIVFTGVSGSVILDTNGERVPEYFVYGRNGINEHSLLASLYYVNNSRAITYKWQYVRPPFWNNSGINKVPLDTPPCGYLGELCAMSKTSTAAIIIGVILGLVLCFGSVAFYYRKQRRERDLIRMTWKFHLKDLQMGGTKPCAVKSMMSMASMAKESCSRSLSAFSHSLHPNDSDNGIFKGEYVIIKSYKKLVACVHLSRQQLIELKVLRDIQHENLNRFVGANVDEDPNVIMLWKFCSKGTLKEIIYNDDIQLDMMFKTSIMKDIVYGLHYLHSSPVGFHGNLSCGTCLVDSRWTVKLTDYGTKKFLHYFIARNVLTKDEQENTIYNKGHVAPELLQIDISNVDVKAADVYSLSIVMYQILFRTEPFTEGTEIDCSDSPNIPEKSQINPNILLLMKRCWSQKVAERPTINQVKSDLIRSSQKYGRNLVDHIMSMLEKYANNLEKLVNERTQQVLEERQRADHLLYQMLPRTVADSLKRGEMVQPEAYDSVTVYFSDIVGFTTLCSQSTPFQVVTMLNDLYSNFDSVINQFDAYKVETIGDAYLVVSGLPTRNGLKHASAIADLALAITQLLTTYTISHFPEHKLQLRIGIHAGPVAAGIVGLKMPRYCLFGDTVNMASRMESTAGKIQISENARNMLQFHNNYRITVRGDINIKGKGLCRTFWLEEKSLLERPLQ